MGISPNLMRALILEAGHKPFRGGVAATIGRQTMGLSIDATMETFKVLDVAPCSIPRDQIYVDATTLASNGKTISDVSFFKLLGFETCVAVDISKFEGAEVIADLNEPIEAILERKFDLIVDGSTIDNVFNPTCALQNFNRMLKENGRMFLTNMGNYSTDFNGIPYTMFTPNWFLDYFVANEFSDCRVYSASHHMNPKHPIGSVVWYAEHRFLTREFNGGLLRPILSSAPISIEVFAEKSTQSSWRKYPTQHAYRQAGEWDVFEARIAEFAKTGRSHLFCSTLPYMLDTYSPGWVYISATSEAINPYWVDFSPYTIVS